MRSHHLRSSFLVALVMALGLSACGDSAGVDTDSQVALSAAEVADIGDTFEDEADLSFGALFHRGTLGWFDLSLSNLKVLFPPGSRPHLPTPLIACLSVSPLPLEDPDGDGVPTELTAMFGEDDCSFSSRRGGGASFALTGTFRLTDPFPNTAGYDLDETFENFGHTHTSANGSRSFQATRNGTRSVRQAGDVLTATEQLTSVWTGTLGPERTVMSDWMVEFTGDAAIVFGDPLPSGSITVDGAWSLIRGRQARDFVVSTVTPLVYDATCAAKRPSRRITAGELHAELMVDGVLRGTLSVIWNGCDMAPTRQFTPA
ncbi:MAG: hypothetical protein HKM89_12430 [Gemmatimonadales bacterium]|nr:hypothetical protein [Gemmatimonadales bacterium]